MNGASQRCSIDKLTYASKGTIVLVRENNHKGVISEILNGKYRLDKSKLFYSAGDLIAEKQKTGFKRASKINQVSDLTKKLREIYRTYRPQWLQHNKVCRAQYEGCTHQATQIHHMAGRDGFWLIMSKYFFPICGRCHRKATKDSKDAIERGVSVSRHKELEYEFNRMEKEMILKAGLKIP